VCHANTDSNSYGNTVSDVDAYTKTFAYTDSNADSDNYAYSYGNTYCYT
jgi:hypothetical protein